MTEKDQKFVSYWEEVMQRGRLKYALLNGFLFGLAIFLFTFLGSYIFDEQMGELYKPPQVFIGILIFWVGGMIFEGGYTWWMNMKRYKRLTSNSN